MWTAVVRRLMRLIEIGFVEHRARDHQGVVLGRVTAVDGANFRVTVTIIGSAVAATKVPYAKNLTPGVNDYVYLIASQASYVVVGIANPV
jgi:hypothetical protein